ncbi:integrase [Vibrio alginolyticus]|uniref:tyrosine-type recombinase/integrase n=1 Tax=Vibrio TaxID=662 RepID=UPI0007A0DFBE|nr:MULTISPECIES: tyrosine-type recombinase/integrase [Vibrio]EGR2555267.1 integrase [Vibrio alginolyticus]EHC9865481.1 tyrosine-type recombinase/integrase [Vibrio alginolyticus]EJS0321354.1 tyrosine-type recombinase/integrase [Vibrio alginolyticus]EJV5739630.1 tyrosine-type recombinase/integrase [Vibrio alginolyticus]EKD1481281.1 tyrosine-type recombinase/integrase [Vibrio alginolyticus]
MYLFRQPNSVYYTRVAIPTSLQKNGFPKEIRLSLVTRDRRTAYKRNLDQTKVIFELFELAQTKSLPFPDFKQKLNAEINKLRVSFNKQTVDGGSTCRLLSETYEPKPKKQIPAINSDSLDRFIESKRLEKVTNLTLKQLKQRNGDFLKFVEQLEGSSITSSVAMAYRDELLGRGLSHKTLRDYFAAIKQFMNWCVVQELINTNPFSHVKLPTKSSSSHSQRQRWGENELPRLFSSQAFQEQDLSFQWATKVMMLHGCRPSEACQLRVADIHIDSPVPIISFTDSGEQQHLKNVSSKRQVPIHKRLLESGFLDYVKARQQQKQAQLFDFIPRGKDLDWSKDFRDIMGDVLTACGFKAGIRPTAYSFRHTFVDELKQANIEEHVVAQIVGHKNASMTYGHYGKQLPVEKLVDAVNAFTLKPF